MSGNFQKTTIEKKNKMDCLEIKKSVKIIDYLAYIGIKPSLIRNQNLWFNSPFRKETKPSFKVEHLKNVWFDFGEGIGGNIFDLIMKLKSVSFSEAVSIVEAFNFLDYGKKTVIYFHQDLKAEIKNAGKIDLYHVQPLKNVVLLNYLSFRGINIDYSVKYIQEAYFRLNGKKFFALAFKNDLGGYELRNEGFKGGNSPKYFTTIPGKDHSSLNIFEGFMDFLSACTNFNRVPEYDTIVLNSVAFLNKIDPAFIKGKKINLFLDNDPSGSAAAKKIMNKYFYVTDYATVIYPDHKDYNEFLMKRSSTKLNER